MFDRTKGGVTADFLCSADGQESDCFYALSDQDLFQYLSNQIYDYHDLCEEHGRRLGSAKIVKWKPLSVAENDLFMVLLMLVAHVKINVLKQYWITNDLTSTPAFPRYMSHGRFVDILSVLHFADNIDVHDAPNEDRLWKLC